MVDPCISAARRGLQASSSTHQSSSSHCRGQSSHSGRSEQKGGASPQRPEQHILLVLPLLRAQQAARNHQHRLDGAQALQGTSRWALSPGTLVPWFSGPAAAAYPACCSLLKLQSGRAAKRWCPAPPAPPAPGTHPVIVLLWAQQVLQ